MAEKNLVKAVKIQRRGTMVALYKDYISSVCKLQIQHMVGNLEDQIYVY
jgi:hypothetical protein